VIAMNDSECDKMLSARRSAKNKKDGFQGCANLGKGCDFNGFYLCTYSPEGLCTHCEIKQFPERYRGCLFCRRPLKYDCCLTCGSGFEEWIKKHTNIETDAKHYGYGQAQFRMCNKDDIPKLNFIEMKREPFYKWPGFYIGDKQWTIPDIHIRTGEEITFDNCHNVLERLLNKHGINIYNDIQYVPKNMPNDTVETI
ncbi:hypothetical protein LCGC14_1975760, partial [marine sediment metagenome]